MASKPVRFHPEAEREYLSSVAWYAERSVPAALDFEAELQRAMSAIAKSPERWPHYLSGCRRYILHQFPFSLVYRARDGEGYRPCAGARASSAGLLEKSV